MPLNNCGASMALAAHEMSSKEEYAVWNFSAAPKLLLTHSKMSEMH